MTTTLQQHAAAAAWINPDGDRVVAFIDCMPGATRIACTLIAPGTYWFADHYDDTPIIRRTGGRHAPQG